MHRHSTPCVSCTHPQTVPSEKKVAEEGTGTNTRSNSRCTRPRAETSNNLHCSFMKRRILRSSSLARLPDMRYAPQCSTRHPTQTPTRSSKAHPTQQPLHEHHGATAPETLTGVVDTYGGGGFMFVAVHRLPHTAPINQKGTSRERQSCWSRGQQWHSPRCRARLRHRCQRQPRPRSRCPLR